MIRRHPISTLFPYTRSSDLKRSTSLKQIVDRAEGYDIPGEIVDGMNFREVRDKIAEIVSSIRKEPHPAFVEVRTYRSEEHTSELQSHSDLVCRLLLEKKNSA